MKNMRGSLNSVRKRRRPAYSCAECRRRKVRCDRRQPCAQCTAQGVASCIYVGTRNAPPARGSSPVVAEPKDICTGGPKTTIEGSSFAPQTTIVSTGRIHGALSKTRVFGYGHWMSTMPMMDGLAALGPLAEYHDAMFQAANPQDQLSRMVFECKQLARNIKNQRPSRRCHFPPNFLQCLPSRQIINEMVDLYFRTFEMCYGIIHRPCFQTGYQIFTDHPEAAESSLVIQLLLTMSVASPLHTDPKVRSEITAKTRSWVHIAQTWLSAPLEKDRLTMTGLQIHCLLLLVRQVHQVGADLVWISAGSLVRMAMQMGLHQDPDNIGGMSLVQKETRRRLWYTIVELNVQAALDSGMSPMITAQDYNTRLPSSILEDSSLDGAHEISQAEKSTEAGKTSIQVILANSLPLRLNATKIINSLQEEPAYDDVLRLGDELSSACRKAVDTIGRALAVDDIGLPELQFATSYSTHLLRRFLLCLHFPYAIKSQKNPLYSHSHRVCLEVSLDLIALLDDDLYSRLLIRGGGMFRDIITRGALAIYQELSLHLEAGSSTLARKRNRARLEPLLEDARRVVQYSKCRMQHGETNVKGYLFNSMATSQIEALLDGNSVKEVALNAARESLETCREILKSMADNASKTPIHSDLELLASSQLTFPREVLDTDFDFDGITNLDFDISNSLFSQHWADEAWL